MSWEDILKERWIYENEEPDWNEVQEDRDVAAADSIRSLIKVMHNHNYQQTSHGEEETFPNVRELMKLWDSLEGRDDETLTNWFEEYTNAITRKHGARDKWVELVNSKKW